MALPGNTFGNSADCAAKCIDLLILSVFCSMNQRIAVTDINTEPGKAYE
jgi:hypothetical protein